MITPLGLVLDIWYGEDDAFVEVARVLLRAGADPSVGVCRGSSLRTLVEVAAETAGWTGDDSVVELLHGKGRRDEHFRCAGPLVELLRLR